MWLRPVRMMRLSVLILSLLLPGLPGTLHAQTTDDHQRSLPPVFNRSSHTTAEPYTTLRVHDVGNLRMTVTNWGVVGNPWGMLDDPQTGELAPAARFPAGFNYEYLNYAALWIGAVVPTAFGDDTLVSTAYPLHEFYPPSFAHGGQFIERSNEITNPNYDPAARATQEFYCVYTDTLVNSAYVEPDPVTLRRHVPLNIRVHQTSHVWPYEYAEDVVIFQYWIVNLARRILDSMWVGIEAMPQVREYFNTRRDAGSETITGFLDSAKSITGHNVKVPIQAAWWADNDGDPVRNVTWDDFSVRSAMAVRFLGTGRSPCKEYEFPLGISYNWWSQSSVAIYDWGPQRKPGDPNIRGGFGTPDGDNHRFRYLANREIDYPQYLANEERMVDEGWIESPGIRPISELAPPFNLADGHPVRLMLSTGPFSIPPGDSIPIGVAIAAGDYFHTRADNGRNLGVNHDAYAANLDFTDLAKNLQWADWVYDHPGVDTDGSQCWGEWFEFNCRDTSACFDEYCFEWHDSTYCFYDICFDWEECDEIYYSGDGVPDVSGPPAPPTPQISITTEPEKVIIRWEGKEPETFFDPFAQRRDFEGYNVYGGPGHNPNALNLMASWDLVNYDVYRYQPATRPRPWVLEGPPLTHAEIARYFGPDVDPLEYSSSNSAYVTENGTRYYFAPHGGNLTNEYYQDGYIEQNLIQYVRTDSVWSVRDSSYQYYGAYECVIDNLLPSVSYYFSVTAFDAGLPSAGLGALESPIQANIQLAYPTHSPESVQEQKLDVSVFPNPYKLDENYRGQGFEDPNREGFRERMRRIHFINLPPECTIKIFTLDGDLVRQIHHPTSRFSDTPTHTAWDLITRNTQAAQSGIYLYSIESANGTQVGKFVIIK